MSSTDREIWSQMRAALWPAETVQEHADMIDALLVDTSAWAFMAEAEDGVAAGFAEVTVRKFANGCETWPVPFLEGIWVHERFRRQKIGAQLIEHIDAFFAARGFREIGSDALVDNLGSQAAHAAWGFEEMERVVCFRKRIHNR